MAISLLERRGVPPAAHRPGRAYCDQGNLKTSQAVTRNGVWPADHVAAPVDLPEIRRSGRSLGDGTQRTVALPSSTCD
jgi:hypothetical protein